MQLNLIDLIELAEVRLGKFKIHLATGWPDPPLTAYFDGRFREWQEWQWHENFKCDKVLAVIHLRKDRWLFAGVWQIEGVKEAELEGKPAYHYSTSEVKGLEHLAGRVVVDFARTFRASYLIGRKWIDQLVVSEILEDKMSMGGFPGYASVLIRMDQLKHIVERDLAEWRSALKSVAGVYLITDTTCGKLYVGSAYGSGGIWGRWSAYASLLHGGNKELNALLQKKGKEHASFLQFSILEICDIKATQDQVLRREAHWKDVLCSREFGYNAN